MYEVRGPFPGTYGTVYYIKNPSDSWDSYTVEASPSGIFVRRRGHAVLDPKVLYCVLADVVAETTRLAEENAEIRESIRAFCKKKVGFDKLRELI